MDHLTARAAICVAPTDVWSRDRIGWTLINAAVSTTGCTCLVNGNIGQCRKHINEAIPDPPTQIFAGRILQAVNFIQVMVIQLVANGSTCLGDIAIIHQPAGFCVHITANRNGQYVAVAVEAGAFVTIGNKGKAVGCLEPNLFGKFHSHRRQYTRQICQRKAIPGVVSATVGRQPGHLTRAWCGVFGGEINRRTMWGSRRSGMAPTRS